MDKLTIEWAAGILEGEGSFNIYQRANRPLGSKQCTITCEMTDKDTIYNLRTALGAGTIASRGARPNRKPTHILSIQKMEEVFSTLINVMPYLNSRRLARAKELFNHLEEKCT